MTEWRFKRLVKDKTEIAGLKYLLKQYEKPRKIIKIYYSSLALQQYFFGGNMSKLIFKTRSNALNIKTPRKWKFAGCI